MAARVLIPAIVGLALIVAFVPWALARRNIHPLVELRLFKNRNMTVAIIATRWYDNITGAMLDSATR